VADPAGGEFRSHLGQLTITPVGGGIDPDTGGALALLWRAFSDGSDGHCFNIDPGLQVTGLAAKANGYFDGAAALARVLAQVRPAATGTGSHPRPGHPYGRRTPAAGFTSRCWGGCVRVRGRRR
jgi:hypothetical protein